MLTKTIIENTLILIGESFWVFSSTAQLIKLLKTHNKHGLSPVNQAINAAGNVAWITYFASRHLWFPFTTNFLLFFITVAVLGYTLTNKRLFMRGITAIAIVGPLTSILLILVPHIGGWLGVAYNTAASTPWLVHIIKTKKTSGISSHSLALAYSATLFTLAYAILIVSYPLIVGCLLGLTYDGLTIRYYLRYRKHA
jgi:uncharacterized protein with PQ loop repeat